MPINGSWARKAAVGGLALVGVVTAAPRAQSLDVSEVLARVGARVAEYYRHVQNIVCYEKSIVQPVTSTMSFSTEGFARVTESELRIEDDGDADGDGRREPTVVRTLLRVNGRAAREKDKTDRAGCTDPNPLSPEPLAFLLPANQHDYKFAVAGFGKGKDRNALILDFVLPGTHETGKLVEDPNGHPDCWSWSLPAALKGRVWIDADSFDVLRVDEHLTGPGTLRVSMEQQRKHNLPEWITIDRYDKTIRLRTTPFKDPDETMMLPESIESLILVRNGLQSIRKEQRFTEYRRFLTGGRIVK